MSSSPAAPAAPAANPADAGPVTDLLTTHPAATDALATLLGLDPTWPEPTWPEPSGPASAGAPNPAVDALLASYPATAASAAALLPA